MVSQRGDVRKWRDAAAEAGSASGRMRYDLRMRGVVMLVMALWAAGGASAQELLSPRAEVSLLTIYPGDQVHALFGHTALRVRDPALGMDQVYNYGTFDFGPLFIPRFVRGKLDYHLSVAPFHAVLDHYRYERRAVVEQVLNLTRAEKDAAFRLLEINALPANREYRYKFLADNCSTRPRDIIEAAMQRRLTWGEPGPEGQTYRQWLAPYLAEDRWLAVGIDSVLGQPVDRVASSREAMFLPLPLMRAADGATVVDGDGTQPLVAQTRRLYWPDGTGEVASSLPWPTIVFWGLLIVAGVMTWRTRRAAAGTAPGPWARRLDAALFGAAGAAGVVVLLLWTATLHDVAGPNWNLLWAWPTHAVAAALQLKRFPSRQLRVLLRGYFQVTAIATTVVLIAWPMLPQALPWALWPVAALLVLRAATRGWRRRWVEGTAAEAAEPRPS